jgi:hypothetical protein
VLDLRPQVLEWRPGIPAGVHRQIVLVRHAVLAPNHSLLLDFTEDRLEILARNSYGDDDLAGAVSGSPNLVAVVTADGFGEPVLWAEKVYGPAWP